MTTLAELNAAAEPRLIERLAGVFEHSPWVAERAAGARPFATLEALHRAMMTVVHSASRAEQLALIRAHPELAGREAVAGALTVDSTGEQGRLGLTALPRAEFERIGALNDAYREKFGFPCIVALTLHHSRESVFGEMQRRLANGRETEITGALAQIGHITRARLERLLEGQ
ncbi:MAG: 2-oxo-4-hydroxy-4-carboxy-5-ureidoimidazoline decarboxylase [Betaproteobacteria bacterium]|nr:2-oxo-4-hydroxy-4-carboxy-5-ureidoimidazoline decarboxylase [Betaproteobacteria bacterium]